MKTGIIALILFVCLIQNAHADDFVKKYEIPGEMTQIDDQIFLTAKQMDFNGDNIPELVLRDGGYLNFIALNPEDNYSEYWTYTGDPAVACSECTQVLFRFRGVRSIDANRSHVAIGYEGYGDGGFHILGLMLVRLSNNNIDWQFDNYN